MLSSLLLALATACREELPPARWTGASLVYRAEPSDTVCGGSFGLQDAYVRQLSDLLHVELDRPIAFSLLGSGALEGFCDSDTAVGCEVESDVFSTRRVHFHELAHAVARRGGVHGTEAFREGFAEAFSNGVEPGKPRAPIEPVLRDFAYMDEDYYTAGLFLRFIVERHTLENVVVFLRRTSRDDYFSVVEREFLEVLGEPLTTTMADFDDYPSCPAWSNRLAIVECGLTPSPWQGTSWKAESAVNCSDEDVLGPLVDGKSLVWTTRSLVVDTPGEFIARTEGTVDGDATVRLTRCASCWDALDLTVLPGQEKQVALPAGQYYVTFIKELDRDGLLKFHLDTADATP